MDEQAAREELRRIGRDLFWMGIQSPRSGNLSVRLVDYGGFLITRRGASLRALDPVRDFVMVPFGREVPHSASSETPVHLGIYEATAHGAVVHAHPPYAVALSLSCSLIRPVHNEGQVMLHDIPVTASTSVEGEGENPEPVVSALRNRHAMVIRGHGAFAAAQDPEMAFYYMALLETACKIIYLSRNVRSA